jgi:signal transduction histidine kinase
MKTQGQNRSSYRTWLIATFAIPWACIVMFSLLYYPHLQRVSSEEAATQQLKTLTEMLAFSVGAGLNESNFELVQLAFDWSRKDSNLVYLGIFDDKNSSIVDFNPGRRRDIGPQILAAPGVEKVNGSLVSLQPVSSRGVQLGTIVLVYSMDRVDQEIRKHQLASFAASVLVLLIGLRGIWLLSRQATELHEAKVRAEDQASLLSEQTQQLSQSNRELASRNAELNQTQQDLHIARNALERRVEERTMMLARSNSELERSNAELSSFAYVVSHDLKAPLRAIGSLADWLANDYGEKLGPEGKELITLLLKRARRMHDLIEGILQYSRVSKVREDPTTVDLGVLLAEVIEELDVPGHITVDVQAGIPSIFCERTPIRQVFQNLLSNAIKFMDKPAGKIHVGYARENGHWIFRITDNGPGIEERHYEKIFQIFQTLSARDEFESTGIGLTIVRKVVETYGGRVGVESRVGAGSTFSFTLPAHETQIT